MFGKPCAGCEARAETIAVLRAELERRSDENRELQNRLCILAGKPEAYLEKDTGEPPPPTPTEEEEIAAEEAAMARLDEAAFNELQRFAGKEGVPLAALHDV
jgi:hypothetical protein